MLALISIGVASFGGCIISGDDTSKGGAAGSPQEYMGTCGAGDEPGSESAGKGGGATKGGSAGQAQAGALSTAGAAGESTMGGESHGSGGASPSAGEAGAGGELTCPSYLQTDTVYQVYPLNRPEMWCVALSKPIVVSCSMLLNPELTVPTAWGETKCVKKDATYYWAGTTLPKADGWQDCTTDEASFVDKAVDCDSLK